MSVSRFPVQPRLARIKLIPCHVFESIERNQHDEPRRRNFRFDLNALADFEQEVGMGFSQLMNMKAGFAFVRALYFCGLKHEDRTLTTERIGELLGTMMSEHGMSIDELMEVAFSALSEQKAIGSPKELEAGANPPSPATVIGAGAPIDIPAVAVTESGHGPDGSRESS